MEGETLLPLKCPNCFPMTASREPFDSSVGLVTTNALVVINKTQFGLSATQKQFSDPVAKSRLGG